MDLSPAQTAAHARHKSASSAKVPDRGTKSALPGFLSAAAPPSNEDMK
jgi:hypothetical protein